MIIEVELPSYYRFIDNTAFLNFTNHFSNEYRIELSGITAYATDNEYLEYKYFRKKLDPILAFRLAHNMTAEPRADWHNLSKHSFDLYMRTTSFKQNVNFNIVKPMGTDVISQAGIRVRPKNTKSRVFSFKPASTNLSFDCKLMQSNIKENSLRYLIQSQKENLRLQPSISWTSTDSENLSDATFRFKAAVSDSKDLFKIYRVLTDNSEKYIGQMSCLDVNEGEFIINWDGDLTEANISTTNFNRSSNNFNISHQFSLIKESFKHKTDNSFYVIKANNGVIEPTLSFDRIIKTYENLLSVGFGKYSWDSKSILNVQSANYIGPDPYNMLDNTPDYKHLYPYEATVHYLLGKGDSSKGTTNRYSARWYTLMISLLSIQEFMQDYFSKLNLQGNKKRSTLEQYLNRDTNRVYSKTSRDPKLLSPFRQYFSQFKMIIQAHYKHLFTIGDEIYPGIEIDYNSMDNYFFANFQNSNINLPTITNSVISTNVSNAEDIVDLSPDIDEIVGNQLNIKIEKELLVRKKFRIWGQLDPDLFIYVNKFEFNHTSMDLKNNFVFTNPDLTWKQEHYNVLENILMSCELLDISNEYNKLSRAHWSEATPSSVIEGLNDRFTTVTFENQDIHIEVIYDE